MRRLHALAALLLALALPAGAAIPEDASFVLDEVEYLYVAGINGTETARLGDTDLAVDACGFMLLNPGTQNGRVLVHGVAGPRELDVSVDRFLRADGKRGYATDQEVSLGGLDVRADVIAQGNGTLRLDGAKYADPMAATGDRAADATLPDLVGSAILLTAQGVMPEAGSAAAADAEDAELHVRLRSRSTGVAVAYQTGSPGDLPDGTVLPTEEYGAHHVIDNVKLGGTATIQVDFQANDLPGSNELRFTVLSPGAQVVAETTLQASALAPGADTLTFPLDEFGAYLVVVGGSMSFGRYTLDVTLAPPPEFALDLWWEDVTYGRAAYDVYAACMEGLTGEDEAEVRARIVGRPTPPAFPLALVAVGVVAAATVLVVAVKLASDQLAGAAFRKAK